MKWRKFEGIRCDEFSSDVFLIFIFNDGNFRFWIMIFIICVFVGFSMRYSGDWRERRIERKVREWEGEEGRRKIEKNEE